jgi:beta-lactamase regulating signal transducer with metallopeptidase domain
MILPYVLKLLCLSLASFFLVHTAFALATLIFSPTAIRLSERMRPRVAARFLFALRLLPLALSVFVVLGLCVPSYLWFEPEEMTEQVGLVGMAAALLGATICIIAILRVLHGIAGSVRYGRQFQRAGREIQVPGDPSPILVLEDQTPFMVLAGVVRPRVVVSSGVMQALSAEQLEVALRHERAHRIFRDNFRRLLLLLPPDVLPLWRGFAGLERSWAKFTEWAADDRATEGDSGRALALAAAIVRLARMGAAPRLSPLATALVRADDNLAARVDRLLLSEPPREQALGGASWGGATLVIAGSLATVMLGSGSVFSSVHALLEHLIR